MIEQEPADIFGYTVFCDDIRLESTGKLLFIGAYQGAMIINAPFPIVLPQLCFSIVVMQKAEVFLPTVGIKIFVPGDQDETPSIEAQMNETVQGAAQKQADIKAEAIGIPTSERKWLRMSAQLQFQNFELKGPGSIKVRADIADKRYNFGSLRVLPPPASSSSALA